MYCLLPSVYIHATWCGCQGCLPSRCTGRTHGQTHWPSPVHLWLLWPLAITVSWLIHWRACLTEFQLWQPMNQWGSTFTWKMSWPSCTPTRTCVISWNTLLRTGKQKDFVGNSAGWVWCCSHLCVNTSICWEVEYVCMYIIRLFCTKCIICALCTLHVFYVCVYVCMYVFNLSLHACMPACMHACTYIDL